MLSDEERYIIYLIRESLNSISENSGSVENNNLSDDIILLIIRRNGILLTIYQKLPMQLQSRLKNEYYSSVQQSIIQEYEGNNILSKLTENGFECIALKGWELKELYPFSNMRQMADLDILVRPYKYETIKDIMLGNGFSESGGESSWKHDNFSKPKLTIEMHKRLTDDSGYISEWEEHMWERTVIDSNNIRKMSFEDFYIFHFIHLHKDFMNGSLGLRRIVDTWLLQKKDINMDYVAQEFKKMGLSLFHEKMIKLSLACMGDVLMDEESELLMKHAFKYGIYGTDKSYKAGRIASMGGSLKKGKFLSGLAAIFLPFNRMKAQFPVLRKWPILLPYYWIVRIIRFLRGDIKDKRKKLDYSTISEEDYEEFRAYLKAGGCSERL